MFVRRIDTQCTGRPPTWGMLTRPACLLLVLVLVLSCGGASLESKALDRPMRQEILQRLRAQPVRRLKRSAADVIRGERESR